MEGGKIGFTFKNQWKLSPWIHERGKMVIKNGFQHILGFHRP